MAFVAAKAGLEYMLDNKVEEQSHNKGEIIKGFIEKEILPLDNRLKMRGIGMVWGIEFEDVDYTLSEKVTEKAFEHNLIIECAGRKNSVVKIMPPLIIEEELLLDGLNRLKEAIEECLAEHK